MVAGLLEIGVLAFAGYKIYSETTRERNTRNIGHRLVDENTLLVVYQKQGIGYSANVSLSEFELTNEAELSKVGP